MMKHKTQIISILVKIKWTFFLIFMVANAFSQSFDPDDLPPEFGLGDDPEPGAPIDIYIPIMMLVMLISLFVYFYKNRAKIESNFE